MEVTTLSTEEQLKILDTQRNKLIHEIAAERLAIFENKYGQFKGKWMRVIDEKYSESIPFIKLVGISELGLQGMAVTIEDGDEYGLIIQNEYYLDTQFLDMAK